MLGTSQGKSLNNQAGGSVSTTLNNQRGFDLFLPSITEVSASVNSFYHSQHHLTKF
jgi:hypothetical protein